MKTWSEIKQATLNKLFLTQEEALQENHLEKMVYLANECLNTIANGVKPKIKDYTIESVGDLTIVEMPDDFITHADRLNIYVDSNGEKYKDPIVFYNTETSIILPEKGTYVIYYNALWDLIEDNNENKELDIDRSVLNCIPSYIASQLLSQDDPQRSAILRNEFELLLARLDRNTMNEGRSFRSEGGWI